MREETVKDKLTGYKRIHSKVALMAKVRRQVKELIKRRRERDRYK